VKSSYPKRLIEVDLPIARISAHSRREKSIRHGHISTLHIWWARRPLAACRAVLCAALWPDPVDKNCPQAFRDAAARLINDFAGKADGDMKLLATSSEESKRRWATLVKKPLDSHSSASLSIVRSALLDFIADFANWDNSTVPAYLETSRALTQAAHEALRGEPGTRPLVVDPFAGGGSIPLEALRVGADAFASDLNPIPVLLNKVVLEYIPKYGQRLADEVRKWGKWIKNRAEKELAEFYPKDPDGATPIAYLWARVIRCDGPGCGAEVPLIRSLWLAKKSSRSVALQLLPNSKHKRVDFKIIVKQRDGWIDQANPGTRIDTPTFDGTVKRGSATCPCCGYTTPVARVREQLKVQGGGANSARLFCIINVRPTEKGRFYRIPTDDDLKAVHDAGTALDREGSRHTGTLSFLPDEDTPTGGGSGAGRAFSQRNYGMNKFVDLFTNRQLLSLTTIVRLIQAIRQKLTSGQNDQFSEAVVVMLSLALDRQADFTSSLCSWWGGGEKIQHTFARPALPIVWDFAEGNPWSDSTGCWSGAFEWGALVAEREGASLREQGHAELASATAHPLPDESACAFVSDPPYYDAVPYADLSDFFYVQYFQVC
jgi:putative DNA methylase